MSTSRLTSASSPFTTAVVRAMRKLYPESLADKSFDNTGLLLEAPYNPARRQKNSVLLTIDLTRAVASEAIEKMVSCVVAYHPIIFRGLKAMTSADPQQASLLRLAAEGISVYCPHTAVDAVAGGMADWLCDVATGTETTVEDKPIRTSVIPHSRKVIVPATQEAISQTGDPSSYDVATTGAGRIVTLDTPRLLPPIVVMISAGTNMMAGLSVATPPGKEIHEFTISTIGVCPGSGGSLLRDCGADLIFTGELGHHDALAITERGGCVVTVYHSNSERGFLEEVMAEKLSNTLQKEWMDVRSEYAANQAKSSTPKSETKTARKPSKVAEAFDGPSLTAKELKEALADKGFEVEIAESDRDPFKMLVFGDDIPGAPGRPEYGMAVHG